MLRIEVGPSEAIAEGTSIEVLHDADTYVVCRHQGALHALEGLCPHRNGPLGAGNFADGHLICPYHGWEFDCVSGAYDRNSSVKLKKFPITEREGWVYIEIA
ncbi:MAG: Rieske (2Fe-2S) protein [Bryobacter sp.]|jgi:nitrite reductase/ring-hydroxylating ferredoxin subunit|nr:Rieske (2Fe-2S) protein [Bryobacter sp. CoA8 C33]